MTGDVLSLWDWRRRIGDLYGEVRRARSARAGHDLWRDTRDELFRTHPQSPVAGRPGFDVLPVRPYDPALRFAVELEPARGETLTAEAGADGAVSFAAAARTRGLADRLGGELTLYWISGYGGGVFLPFQDATSGAESYGGGRYLLDTIKGADLGRDEAGRAILDFNFAYNPSCAYSDRWVCPLSPPENRLPARIAAGEMAPGGRVG